MVLVGLGGGGGGCGVGAAGCLWFGGCSILVVYAWFWSCLCLETMPSLELKGSREDIIYDEIYITIIKK